MAVEPRDAARRRMLLKKAIFGGTGGTDPGASGHRHVVTGTVLDASPHILVIANEAGVEERFALMETHVGVARRGGAARLARPGCRVVLRRHGQSTRRGPDLGRYWARHRHHRRTDRQHAARRSGPHPRPRPARLLRPILRDGFWSASPNSSPGI